MGLADMKFLNHDKILVNLDFNKGDIIMGFGMLSWATYSALLKKT